MDEGVPHNNGGSIAGFTPNMSNAQVKEFDRRRGLGDMGTFKEPDFLINKKPWLRADGTHKAQDEGDMSKTQEAIQTLKGMRVPEQGQYMAKNPGKAGVGDDSGTISSGVGAARLTMPAKPKAPAVGGGAGMMGPKAPSQARTGAGRVINNPFVKNADDDTDENEADDDIGDKLFGKADKFGMAASQRAHQRESGRRERSIGMRHAGKSTDADTPDPKSEKDDVVLLEKLLNHEKEEELEEEKKGMVLPGETSKFDSSGMSSPSPSPPPSTGPTSGGTGPSMGIGKSLGAMDMLKALNSRSMHIPAPHGPYDPFGVQRSGSSIQTSGSMTHEGVPHTLQTAHETHDVCSAHGITYRKSLGCAPCTLAKSFECKTCGTTMHKSMGGVYRCARGH